jgi:hypothetical protein
MGTEGGYLNAQRLCSIEDQGAVIKMLTNAIDVDYGHSFAPLPITSLLSCLRKQG